jgi:hypothetical protein
MRSSREDGQPKPLLKPQAVAQESRTAGAKSLLQPQLRDSERTVPVAMLAASDRAARVPLPGQPLAVVLVLTRLGARFQAARLVVAQRVGIVHWNRHCTPGPHALLVVGGRALARQEGNEVTALAQLAPDRSALEPRLTDGLLVRKLGMAAEQAPVPLE